MKSDHPTFEDHRGSFTAIKCEGWEQTNVCLNTNKYTFRGMHYQTEPPQTKYVKVIQGSIVDILYNLETKETHFFHLNNQESLLVLPVYAHGFLTLEKDTIVSYLINGKYNPASEHSIIWKDVPEIKDTILTYCNENEITISKKDLFNS